MIKKILVLLGAAMFAFGIAACNKAEVAGEGMEKEGMEKSMEKPAEAPAAEPAAPAAEPAAPAEGAAP